MEMPYAYTLLPKLSSQPHYFIVVVVVICVMNTNITPILRKILTMLYGIVNYRHYVYSRSLEFIYFL